MQKNGDFDLDFFADDGTALELDFNPDDFDFINPDDFNDGEEQTHILTPKIDKRILKKSVDFCNAKAFARQLDLDQRLFCWVSGSFIFGDVIEALMLDREIDFRALYVSSLGASQENIDSLRNCLEFGRLERFVLILSAYFYSHEKGKLVPYIYEELDGCRNALGNPVETQIVFGNYHCKIITFETYSGQCYTLHGSANLRSSQCIEQIMCDPDPDLYRFNAETMENIAKTFGTINAKVPGKLKPMRGRKGFDALKGKTDG